MKKMLEAFIGVTILITAIIIVQQLNEPISDSSYDAQKKLCNELLSELAKDTEFRNDLSDINAQNPDANITKINNKIIGLLGRAYAIQVCENDNCIGNQPRTNNYSIVSYYYVNSINSQDNNIMNPETTTAKEVKIIIEK